MASVSHALERFISENDGARPPDALIARSPVAASIPYLSCRTTQAATSMLGSGNESLAALTYSAKTASSQTSIVTPTRFTAGRTLEPNQDGVLQLPPLRESPTFECPFNFLNCHRTFGSYEHWLQHSLEHFGPHQPPSQNECRFCDTVVKAGQTKGVESWKALMKHMELHFTLGHRFRHARPAFNLYRYLWQKGLIDSLQFKMLMGSTDSLSWRPSSAKRPGQPCSVTDDSSSYYTVTSDNRRRRRRHV